MSKTSTKLKKQSVIAAQYMPKKVPEPDLEIDDNLYKNILVQHDPNGQTILSALNIVKKYIIREKLIIVGGMAIDFALRLRGSNLYSNDEVPDYDFNTPRHWHDAYEIAQWLNRVNIEDVSVINALHPTTMRVRISGTSVADSTYIPRKIFENIPRLNYHGFDLVHPFYQYIDQHRALSYGYENIDMDRPVLRNRWTKDMKRYELLWEKYPLKWDGAGHPTQDIKLAENEYTLPLNVVSQQCLTGFAALQYWTDWAGQNGFKSNTNLGKCNIGTSSISVYIPVGATLSLYCNDIKRVYAAIKKINPSDKEVFYERYLDKLPRRIIIGGIELIDNQNHWLAAHKIRMGSAEIYVANLQPIMLYMLLNYLILGKIAQGGHIRDRRQNKSHERSHNGNMHSNANADSKRHIYYAAYMQCRNLLKFGAEHNIVELLPTSEYYGEQFYTESYTLMKNKFMLNNGANGIVIPAQPRHVYDRDLKFRTVPPEYYKFDPATSELFQMDGEECKKFI
jgi:hypothetical protein